MNKRQALKAAAENLRIATLRNDELERVLKGAQADIKTYNEVIDAMIQGKAPCEWCEDYQECQLEAKGKGCELWWLRYPQKGEIQDDDGERILSDGGQRGIEDQSVASEAPSLRGSGPDNHKRPIWKRGIWTEKWRIARRAGRYRHGGRYRKAPGSDRQVPDADRGSGTGDQ